MKLHEIVTLQPTTHFTYNLYRGITGKLADIARTGGAIPESNRKGDFWIWGMQGDAVEDTLLDFDMDLTDNYATPGGVLIHSTVTIPVVDNMMIFPSNYGICGDDMSGSGYGIKIPVNNNTTGIPMEFYIVSRGITTKYNIIADYKKVKK